MEYVVEDERIYVKDPIGRTIAEVTFPTKNGIATINHTFVDDSLRGEGIAGNLVERAVEKIKADGNKLAATCPYAIVWLQRHPQ